MFALSALAILPRSALLGRATEELSAHTGPTIGGLLNATLGNLAELIIAGFALRGGLIDLVKASITGSILGNLATDESRLYDLRGCGHRPGGVDRILHRVRRESNWLEGAYLLVVYGMLAVAFYFFGFCLRFRLQRQRPTAPIRPAPRR